MKRPTKEQLAKDIATDMTWAEIAKKYNYSGSQFLRKLRKRYDLPQRRVYRKPSEKHLRRMIYDEGLTPYEIADKLGYADGGWSNIYKYCRDYGIKFDFRRNAHLYARPFTDRQKSLVLGSVLGDATLTAAPNSNSVYCSMTHGSKQLEYLMWKLRELSPYVICKTAKRTGQHPGGGYSTVYSSRTIAHPWLTSTYPLCYPNGVKIVSLEWLNQIDEFALAVWFMDDGSLNKRYGTMVLCTNPFDYNQHTLMQQWFYDRWGIETKLEPRRNNQYMLRINASIAGKLREIISPHIIPPMRYKVNYG